MLFETAFRIVVHEKEKFSGAVVGVAIAVFLMILQGGFYLGYLATSRSSSTRSMPTSGSSRRTSPFSTAGSRSMTYPTTRPGAIPTSWRPPGWSGATPRIVSLHRGENRTCKSSALTSTGRPYKT